MSRSGIRRPRNAVEELVGALLDSDEKHAPISPPGRPPSEWVARITASLAGAEACGEELLRAAAEPAGGPGQESFERARFDVAGQFACVATDALMARAWLDACGPPGRDRTRMLLDGLVGWVERRPRPAELQPPGGALDAQIDSWIRRCRQALGEAASVAEGASPAGEGFDEPGGPHGRGVPEPEPRAARSRAFGRLAVCAAAATQAFAEPSRPSALWPGPNPPR